MSLVLFLMLLNSKQIDANEGSCAKKSSCGLDKMSIIPSGDYFIGTDSPIFESDNEGPKRSVSIKSFAVDIHEVSNEDFQEFVTKTGHKTEAESYGTSFVLESLIKEDSVKNNLDQEVAGSPWWLPVKGASWKNPEGHGSFISDRMNHPVVHVSFNDAQSFCRWKGKRLPTEMEWEVACRGGLKDRLYSWGNNWTPRGTYYANTFQGYFPLNDSGDVITFIAFY
jgi:sulfatase modifying factor 1